MERNIYTNEDLMNLFITHGQCDKIVARTCRKFNEGYPNLQEMDKRKFVRIQNNFIQFGSQLKNNTLLPKPVTSDENNIVNVLAYFHAYPQASIRSAANDLGLTYYSVQRILDENNMHSFKFSKVLALKPTAFEKIIWTDEKKFSREGIFNRRNENFWANQNPYAIKEMGLSFNVFDLLEDNQIAFFIYFRSLNSQKSHQILRSVVEDFMENLTLEDYRTCWFQLDRAPAHCTKEVTRELFEKFDDRWL